MAATTLLHSGGSRREFRGIGVISVAIAELPADTKSQFGAMLPQLRRSFQRENGNSLQKLPFPPYFEHFRRQLLRT